MRSATSLLPAALALLAAGCGNYSTEDLVFLSALPRRADLEVRVPPSAAAAPATGLVSAAAYSATCAAGTTRGDATVWQWAKPASDGINAGVDFLVGLVDTVRRHPPTARHEDSRRWGPFDAERHPGREIQVVIDRSWPSGSAGPPSYAYRFQARVKGTAIWTDLVTGHFDGHSSARGAGDITLDFVAFHAVGVADARTPAGGSMRVVYDRASDPATIDLDLLTGTAGGFGVVSFGYRWTGWEDGFGAFDYAFRNGFNDLLEVSAAHDPTGAGRLAVDFTPDGAGAPTGSFRQCFDAASCLRWVEDAANLSCEPLDWPCTDVSDPGACVAVRAPPFPDP